MGEDFETIARKFNAMSSVVRVPALDPKYKMALLLSKQVNNIFDITNILFFLVILSWSCVIDCSVFVGSLSGWNVT